MFIYSPYIVNGIALCPLVNNKHGHTYLSVHLGAVVPKNLKLSVHVLRDRILHDLRHPGLIERRRSLLVVSVLLRHGLMPLNEPGARRYERTGAAVLAAAGVREPHLGTLQDGHVEAVGS